jgi:hypothetical protein
LKDINNAMKKRNKVLLTVGTLVSVYLAGDTIQKNTDISAADMLELVSPQVWTDRPEQLFGLKDINPIDSTQFYTQKGEYGCGANHHVDGGCGSNHMAEEKYDNLPSEHNPGNRLQEQK